jgi:short-subunit dehydrogenase
MGTALITGASSGIGYELALQLAQHGYALLLVARRQERLTELAQNITSNHHVKVGVIACDLTDRDELGALMAKVDAWLDTQQEILTLLVNNAGSGFWAEFKDQDMPQVQRDINLNITALTLLSHAFITRANQHDQPAYLLNIASLAALLPAPRFAVYSGSKGYVTKFTEVLAYELRHTNIHPTCVCPGGVLTEFMDHAGQELKGNLGMMSAKEVAQLSLNALFAGKVIYVPGTLNKASMLARLLPRGLRSHVVGKSMQMTVKPK